MIVSGGTDTRDERVDIDVTDKIVLTIPAERGFRGVVTLVLGGVGSRLNLPYERMDDLQLALLAILEAASGDEVSIEIEVEDHHVSVAVGPLAPGSGRDDGLVRVVSKLVDSLEPKTREDGDGEWLTVTLGRSLPELR